MNAPAALLLEFYREKLETLQRHIAGARLVSQYDANNAYQYIINREETQLSWIAHAILDLGGQVDESGPDPDRQAGVPARDASRRVFEEDARDAEAFVVRWKPRVASMTNARQRRMLEVVLGEAAEQQRFFEQALAGDPDLLGKRSEAAGVRVGHVMSTRWIE